RSGRFQLLDDAVHGEPRPGRDVLAEGLVQPGHEVRGGGSRLAVVDDGEEDAGSLVVADDPGPRIGLVGEAYRLPGGVLEEGRGEVGPAAVRQTGEGVAVHQCAQLTVLADDGAARDA